MNGDKQNLEKFLNRTKMLFGEEAINILGKKKVAFPGCGGVGGATAVLLARLGIGGFILADPGKFDEPDVNRQWAASVSQLGKNKAEVYAELLLDINPNLKLDVYTEGITENNLKEIIDQADFVVDGLDIAVPLSLRLQVYQYAREKELFCASSPIWGLGTLMMIAEPGGMPLDKPIMDIINLAKEKSQLPSGFANYFFPEHIENIEKNIKTNKVPSCAIGTALSASTVCTEILLVFLRELFPHWRKPITLPEILVIETLGIQYQKVNWKKLFPG